MFPFVSFERMHSYHTEPVQTCVCVTLTDSELQIALVALFSEMLYRFPNVVVAQLTRESVQQAIANGITAQQVLLRWAHLHTKNSVLIFPVLFQSPVLMEPQQKHKL